MFERNYSFFHHCLLSCRCEVPKTVFLAKQNGGHKQPLRGHGPPCPHLPPRSDSTG